MEIVHIEKNIPVFFVTATSFPEGIADAHEKLRKILDHSKPRNIYGISRPENGQIIYRAAAQELYAGEGKQHQCETLVLPAGDYASLTVEHYAENISAINNNFQDLLHLSDIDKNGYCVEWYFNNEDVKCMVRLEK